MSDTTSVRVDLHKREIDTIDRLAKKNKRTRKAETHALIQKGIESEKESNRR